MATQPARAGSAGSSAAPVAASKPGFFSWLNPFNWFRHGSETSSASTVSGIARYRYQSPAKPVAGNIAAGKQAFNRGWQAQQKNHLPEAVQAYLQATRLNPADFDAYYNLGSAAATMGNLTQALVAYEFALAIRADSSDARYNFALALKQANYPLDAADQLERLISVYPGEVRAHLALGNLFAQQLHDPAQAREHYTRVLDTDPGNPQATAIRNWMSRNPP